jgi:hypothetical protein
MHQTRQESRKGDITIVICLYIYKVVDFTGTKKLILQKKGKNMCG